MVRSEQSGIKLKGDTKMKNLTRIFAVCLTAALLVCCAAGCGKKEDTSSGKSESSQASTAGDSSGSSAEDSASSAESSAAESAAESSAEASTAEASVDLNTADYDNPAVTIEFGDFELIQQVTKDMQTGKYDGKVIKVTGISERRMNSCTVMERDEANGKGYGMTYYLDGQPDVKEYPAEATKVILLGVVTTEEYGVRALTVLPNKVTVTE